jgi:hypothetical protein
MTYETLDTALNFILTATIYGGALVVVVSFIIFVARHDLRSDDCLLAEPENLIALKPSEAVLDDSIKETIVAGSDQQDIQTVTPAQIAEQPVDFSLWKVNDLRCPGLRAALNVPLREGKRLLRKAELIAFYQQAYQQEIAT